MEELLGTNDLVVLKEGKELANVPVSEVLAGANRIGLYFSAHWCPPCRGFTPLLVDVYNELKEADKGFQVVFVSSDRSADSMKDYMEEAKMPWPAVPFGDPRVAAIKKKFEISSIPTLIILNSQGELVTRDGRGTVLSKGPRAFEQW